ncbi:lipopolysaccharide biosynthesis protein [Streptomonospora wellingtoniae]|uniref:Polysaccharide biosynthesis C-terminal domain-containing protein n=1 Tax=Streptomonospora wellingtoniae TaxID=3075544 RepID=A0ABU2KT07_9ACTN|nr:polysaccharide biosynthesis C-terminal domain-containing protein [Streptomonospora sp. DSM 45055]MDT0302263.1 polysaccharide biosynthesis C-terminal domain-containing protein [Streptomonospora sp. DSM 45055]
MAQVSTAGHGRAGLRRVARGGAMNMAGAAAGAVLNLAIVVAVARGFSADTAGLLFSATSVFLLASAVANLGTPSGLVYFLARLRARGAEHAASRVLRTALGPAAASSLAGAVAMFALADDLASLMGEPDAEAYLRLVAAFLPCAVLTDAALAATRAHHVMRAGVLLDKVGRPLAQLVLIAAVAASGWAGLLTVAWAGPYLPAAVLAWWWMRRILGAHRTTREAPPSPVRPVAPDSPRPGRTAANAEYAEHPGDEVTPRAFWAFSLPRSLATVAQLGIQRLGIVFVAALAGPSEAAVFTAASRFPVAGQFAAQALQYSAEPRLAELLAEDDRRGANTLFRASTAWLICLSWPLFLPAIVYAPLLMETFGARYAAGAPVLAVVCLAQLLAAALGMGDLVLAMTGRTRLNLANNLLALAANVALCLVLVPSTGAGGAAAAFAGAVAVRKALPLVQLGRSHGLHPFGARWVLAAGSCLVWFGGAPLLCAAVLGTGPWSLAVAMAIGSAGLGATLWRLRDRLELDHLLRRDAVLSGPG